MSIAAVITTVLVSPSTASGKADDKTPKGKAMGYWTKDKLENALTRDFEFEIGAKSGKLVALGKSAKGGGAGTTGTTGASWTKGSKPLAATGKVFFTMGALDYVCSGSLITEATTGRSIVLTAGHCVWDNKASAWATYFIFIPAYDSNPINNCSSQPDRCLVASALVASSGFTTQTSFSTQATTYDWAFAAVEETGESGFNLAVGAFSNSATAYAFGYPAARPYSGNDLVYCAGPISQDIRNSGMTWGLSCNMTGGSSGGPWLAGFDTSTYLGSASSLNSYKYGNDSTKMYGPKFDARTTAVFNSALTATVNTVVDN
jgi:V8-like Glu-specific endopeptidase